MSGQNGYSRLSKNRYGKTAVALIALFLTSLSLSGCSLVQGWWQRAGQAAQDAQKSVQQAAEQAAGSVQRTVQEKSNELQSAVNQKIEEAAAEAQKRFNEQKDKLIDDYTNQLKSNLKDSTNLNLPAGQAAPVETK